MTATSPGDRNRAAAVLIDLTHPPTGSKPAAAAMVGSQSVTCIIPVYSVPHISSGMWLLEYMKAGTY